MRRSMADHPLFERLYARRTYVALFMIFVTVAQVSLMFSNLAKKEAVAVNNSNLSNTMARKKQLPFGTFPKFTLPATFGRGTASATRAPEKIYDLPTFLSHDSNKQRAKTFQRIYEVEEHSGRMQIPDKFAQRVRSMFASYPGGTENLDFIEKQTVLTTSNRYTNELSMFNEVRRYRPGYAERLAPELEHKFEAMVNASMGDKCDFCHHRVAVDVFGSIHGAHCYIASNVAKYHGWHALVVASEHHPLKFSAAAIEDYLTTAYRWFSAVRAQDPLAAFPHLMWDAGPRAAASQVHQHLQLIMTKKKYLARAEQTRLDAARYELKYPAANYWADVAAAHDAVGLAVRLGPCAVMSSVTPIKERELIVVCASGADPSFARLLYIALRTMIDDVGTRAFSAGITFEPLMASHRESHYPAVARIVDRGPPTETRNDVGAMEFFGSYNVGADPYHIMPFLRNRVEAARQQYKRLG
eukprot:PhM_4_TR4024/c0_g1_i1/m.47066